MQNSKEALYHAIGNAVAERIEDTWTKARVTFEVLEEDVHGMECVYEAAPPGGQKTFVGGLALYHFFLELRQIMADEGSGSWRKATFELEASGKFDLDFGY